MRERRKRRRSRSEACRSCISGRDVDAVVYGSTVTSAPHIHGDRPQRLVLGIVLDGPRPRCLDGAAKAVLGVDVGYDPEPAVADSRAIVFSGATWEPSG